jgi:HAD superfamily hydrolase (TIGR01490 family)
MAVSETLRARRFFITGGTGFLGTALIERILRALPESEVVLLIRPGRRATAHDRAMKEIIRNDCFDRLREELGDDFDAQIARRVSALAGDVTSDQLGLDAEGLAHLSRCDTVIHSAAAVSFDSPLDQAVEINLLGPTRVGDAMAAARTIATTEGRPGPGHLIAVSTCYVASTFQGEAREHLLGENRFDVDVDWRTEVTSARRLREDLEAESRRSPVQDEITKRARRELGSAGSHVVAIRAEKLRDEWVRDHLVKAGTTRSQALGWPDAYPYTKALGERALVEAHGPRSTDPLPISIVRPSIIESAMAEPKPGWIRGFRMAEPIIISYARGLLKEFPGVPEGIVDVIPVDMVVADILLVAAHGPEQSEVAVYQVASGVRNPLRYGRLVGLVQEWFTERPLYDDQGQPISVPAWSFPGRGRVQRQLKRATSGIDAVEKVLHALPLRGKRAQIGSDLEERSVQAKRALGYVELYGSYTETEARYRIDRTLTLFEALDEDDKVAFAVDPAVIDWNAYVAEIHLPSVVKHARVRTAPGTQVMADRTERGRKAVLSRDRQLAVFDLENTLMASNVVDTFSWLASRHLPLAERASFVAELLRDAPNLLALDRRDRGDFLRTFYLRYEGASVEQLRTDSWELFSEQLLLRSYPEGFARVREHRRLGHRTLLITGALDVVIEPFAPLFDDVICARLGVQDGRFTGRMEELPPIGEARANVLEDYAEAHSLKLSESVAYADSTSDLALLEAVGFPVAVNPEARLASIARRRGWLVENWERAQGGSSRTLPLGRLDPVRPGAAWRQSSEGDR